MFEAVLVFCCRINNTTLTHELINESQFDQELLSPIVLVNMISRACLCGRVCHQGSI